MPRPTKPFRIGWQQLRNYYDILPEVERLEQEAVKRERAAITAPARTANLMVQQYRNKFDVLTHQEAVAIRPESIAALGPSISEKVAAKFNEVAAGEQKHADRWARLQQARCEKIRHDGLSPERRARAGSVKDALNWGHAGALGA